MAFFLQPPFPFSLGGSGSLSLLSFKKACLEVGVHGSWAHDARLSGRGLVLDSQSIGGLRESELGGGSARIPAHGDSLEFDSFALFSVDPLDG